MQWKIYFVVIFFIMVYFSKLFEKLWLRHGCIAWFVQLGRCFLESQRPSLNDKACISSCLEYKMKRCHCRNLFVLQFGNVQNLIFANISESVASQNKNLADKELL